MKTKLRHHLATFAALALLAGCGQDENMSTPKQSAIPAVTNEAPGRATTPSPAAPSAELKDVPPVVPPTNSPASGKE